MRTKSMMFAAIALAASAMGLVCGCTKAPSHVRVAPAVAPASVGFASERWPTEAEAAAWTITRDEAMRIGRERVELPSDSHMIYHSSPVVRDGKEFWRITATSAIAGGWEAEIDAHTGVVLRSRRMGGR